MVENSVTLVGGYGSPYSRKMRAVLRYRRIPHRWVIRGTPESEELPRPPVDLIPVVFLPDRPDEALIDSTPLIRRLEAVSVDRSVIPTDPALAFVDALIEDYGDEWLTKAMFHYRWAFPEAVQKAGRVLALDHHLHLSEKDLEELSKAFTRRQVGRLEVVGSNPTTAPVIEDSYVRLLRILDGLFEKHPFVLGGRPGSGDFGIFGQLTQLVLFDPPSMNIAAEVAPRVISWTQRVEDLSWLDVGDDDWLSRDQAAETVRPLLAEIGRIYVPFLLANAAAVGEGRETVECEFDGRAWTQSPFKYQAKCLGWLRDGYAALDAGDRAWIDETFAGTGCEALFVSS
jgi:glutathione S-transferase